MRYPILVLCHLSSANKVHGSSPPACSNRSILRNAKYDLCFLLAMAFSLDKQYKMKTTVALQILRAIVYCVTEHIFRSLDLCRGPRSAIKSAGFEYTGTFVLFLSSSLDLIADCCEHLVSSYHSLTIMRKPPHIIDRCFARSRSFHLSYLQTLKKLQCTCSMGQTTSE